MPTKRLSPRIIKDVLILHAINGVGTTFIARSLNIARTTVFVYIKLYNKSGLVHTDILNLSAESIVATLRPPMNIHGKARYDLLRDLFLLYHQRIKNENINLKVLWREYSQSVPSGLKYSQFLANYHKWRIDNGFPKVSFNK